MGFSKRIFPFENTFLKAREAFESAFVISCALQPLVVNLESRERSLYEFGDRRRAFDVKNCERSPGGFEALGQRAGRWMIPDGKILQSPVAVHANAACADSAQGHGDLRSTLAAESAL